MKVLKQNMRLVLMSLLLIICGATFAQTQVVFEAGVDKGQISGRLAISGEDKVEKDGVTLSGSYSKLGRNPYEFNSMFDQNMTISSSSNNISKIEIEGSNLSNINRGVNVGTFDASTGVWTGNGNNIVFKYHISSFTIKKITVTLSESVATTLSFGDGAQQSYTVYKSKEGVFNGLVATVTENKTNSIVEGAAVKYSSSNPEAVAVDENLGTVMYYTPGEATITASYAGVDGVYDAAKSISYNVVYKKIPTTLSFSDDLSNTVVVYKGEENAFINGYNIYADLKETLENTYLHTGIKYSSSDENIVAVDENTGELTFKKAGAEVTITASYAGTDVYEATPDATYKIKYSLATTALSFGEDAQENYTVFRGQEKNFTALKATLTDDRTDEAIEGNVKYSSNNADVVSVDETTGALTFGNIGTATITASFDGVEGAYEPAESISYTIDYKKNSLELAYSKSLDVIYADNKDSYEIPSITITSTLDTDDLAINYETSNADVATVDEKGKITLVGNGEATITASVKDNNLFDDATATYTVRVADPDNIFYESFDNVEGKGGNDGTWEAGDGDTFNSALCDNEGWYEKSTTGGTYQTVLQGDKCLNIYGQAALISGDMKYLNGAAILTFKAGAAVKNNPATPSLKITVVDGNKNIVEQSVEVPVGEFKEYSIVIPNGTPNTRLEFWGEQASNRFLVTVEYNIFIDDVKVVRLVPISETTDNTAILAANDGNDVNVMLDRKLSNEYWNTVCFPFNMDEEQINTLFGAATQIREFNRVENSEMVFVEPNTKAIVAGTPYLFKPENNIDNSLFFHATVDNSNNAVAYADAEGKEYKFVGVTSPTALLATDIFIGTDQSLYYPNMETEGANIINGMRAYIQLPEGTDAKAFAINTNGVATSISNINNTTDSNNTVYTISGQKVGKYNGNLPKGIYVMNGKKFVVK